ncbi:MAG: GNAT family N-acetyltransferase [Promethearchaeota archaeon]
MINENLNRFKKKRISIENAIQNFIKPGDRIFIGSGCSEPIDFVKKLIDLAPKLPDIEILHLVNLSDLDYYKTAGGKEDLFRHNTFFIGNNLRAPIQKGMADYTPMLLSDIPRFIKRGRMHIKTALLQLSPPDKEGFCSYGINVDIAKPIAEVADNVIAEINPKMPYTFGDSKIHMDDIDAFVDANHDIVEFNYNKPNENAKKIGKYVASLIEDESTIQTGIGIIPNVIAGELEEKKDLGVHSEVFSDGIVDLVNKGVITCEKKTIHKGKIICSFVMGSRKLYDFVDQNPMVEFYPCDYCNDSHIISQNKKQIAINAALTVDLTGQVNADSLGPLFYSGIGGQVDFIRGAGRSDGGKPISVLPSTATLSDGTVVSRIVPFLQQGSGVVITRGDVHYVVTEWGIADLFGKNIRDRVLQMINIAHPDFREDLLEYAKKWNYVYSDQKLPKSIEGRISLYPEKYEKKLKLSDGRLIKVRPIKTTDERMLQELYYSMDRRDRYLRFFTFMSSFEHKRIQPLVNIDYTTNMILVGEYDGDIGKKLIASAGFFKTPDPSTAEIALVVDENWRNNNLAQIFLDYLVIIAKELNYRFFSGSVLIENKPMMHIINKKFEHYISRKIDGGVLEFKIDLSRM